MMDELRRVDPRFGDDNPVLLSSLGMLSAASRLERLIDVFASRPEGDAAIAIDTDAMDTDVIDTDATDAAGIDFVLGLLAAKATLKGRLAEAAETALLTLSAEGAPSTASADTESFLR